MISAINKGANDIGENDVLVLDACYFNSIEVIYELGKEENHSVKSVITYIKNGAINLMLSLVIHYKGISQNKSF